MSSPRPRPTPRKSAPSITPPAQVTPPPPTDAGRPVAPPPAFAPPPTVAPPPADAEYTESLVVPSQVALGVTTAIAALVILLALGLWPLAVLAVLLAGAVVYYLGVQILTVSPKALSISQGRGDKSPHLVQAADVIAAEVATLTWPQCFGFGRPDTVDTSRFTVRAGPALSLTMRDGELLCISAANPQAALDLLGR